MPKITLSPRDGASSDLLLIELLAKSQNGFASADMNESQKIAAEKLVEFDIILLSSWSCTMKIEHTKAS